MEDAVKYGTTYPSRADLTKTEAADSTIDVSDLSKANLEKYDAMLAFCRAEQRLGLLVAQEAETKAFFKHRKKELMNAVTRAKDVCRKLGIATDVTPPIVVQYVSGETGELFSELDEIGNLVGI